MKNALSPSKGFTLVELLVVIAAITILAALLLRGLAGSRDRSRRITCVNNLRQINLGLRMYSDDTQDKTPNTRATNRINRIANWTGYKQFMKGYVGLNGSSSAQDKLFACPADTFYYGRKNGRIDSESKSLHDQLFSDFSSYGFNGGNADTNQLSQQGGHPLLGIAGRLLSSISVPTRTILVAEFPAFVPYSWHQPKHAMAFNNARNEVSFVDGHVSYLRIYWNSIPQNFYLGPACGYDPPPDYDYQWSGD
jgi:prepilin-type N-terminal cleavage/methylation domain-containing protein